MTGMPPFRFGRPALITPEQSARVHELALSILKEVGLAVHDERLRARLESTGLRVRGERLLLPPDQVNEHVEETRRWLAAHPPAAPLQDDRRLRLRVSSYSLYVQDVETGRALPYTTERLVEMCKFVDTLADDGIDGAPPGIPTDVHPDLQPVAQYRIAALHARQGATPVDPTSARTVGCLLDMAEVMGCPIRSLPIYVVSPLRLGGESLDVVLACADRLSHILIRSMPSTGASAPLHPFGALAQAAAEVIGGMVALRVLTGKPVNFRAEIYPFDIRRGMQVFGAPESLLYGMLCSDFNGFYGWPTERAVGNIQVMPKLPDSQAAGEKAASMALAASLGARNFGGAGILSLDDIFSPEQLLVDMEIRDWVQRVVQGVWLGEEAVGDWLGEIKAGLKRGFLGLDSTLDYHRASTWYPRWFERGNFGSWVSAGEPRLTDRLRAEVRRRLAAHDFELDSERRREIECIYGTAERAVGG